MARIGLLTVHCSINFGASLQAYALGTYLNQRGNKVDIINYRFEGFVDLYDPTRTNKLTFKQRIKKCVFHRITYGRFMKFKEFEEKYLPKETRCISKEEFGMLEGMYDVFIVGSDQVWNPSHVNYDDTFFLKQIHNGICGSFAASIGKKELINVEKDFIKTNIAHMNFISVREESGRGIIESLRPGTDIYVHMDPVFLLETRQWDLISKTIETPPNYALLYIPGEVDDNLCRRIVSLIRKEGYVVLHLKARIMKSYGDVNIYDAGPREFVYLIKHASKIITNSFHGAAFSIMFEKPLVSLECKDKNERLNNLFRVFDISNTQLHTENQYKNGLWKINMSRLKERKEYLLDSNRNSVNNYFEMMGV